MPHNRFCATIKFCRINNCDCYDKMVFAIHANYDQRPVVAVAFLCVAVVVVVVFGVAVVAAVVVFDVAVVSACQTRKLAFLNSSISQCNEKYRIKFGK